MDGLEDEHISLARSHTAEAQLLHLPSLGLTTIKWGSWPSHQALPSSQLWKPKQGGLILPKASLVPNSSQSAQRSLSCCSGFLAGGMSARTAAPCFPLDRKTGNLAQLSGTAPVTATGIFPFIGLWPSLLTHHLPQGSQCLGLSTGHPASAWLPPLSSSSPLHC